MLKAKLIKRGISELSPIIIKLRDRKQIVSQPVHKSDIIQGEAIIYLDDVGPKHLTLLVIPKKSHTPCVTGE
jgi:hypothetical protein